ncbi:hypothetical protein O0I10_010134 [Lichtheimia ornata]|uniref:Enkurin domain-containing protein n=1 Tax=Lichtheimia ornata TaxID=688661 RepID=A0AAD7XVC6_9FUNG|nr:uncharacterized protein O0I10_010134 [Lichtheimia ornata]KAJ8654186.1 hypothetical protein O0I10_010134 [Lichtheimia ornata]
MSTLAGNGYEMLKFWKMFDTGPSSSSQQDMSKKSSSSLQARQRNDSVASLKAQHRASAYFAMPTTTTSNDSITQQRHQSCIFSSSSIQLLNNESSMQQQRSSPSCSKPTQEGSNTSREWQVIEAATAAAAVGNVHCSSSSTASTDTTNTTATATVLYKNTDEEIISLRAELEKEKSTVVALRKQNQAMTQNMTQLEITNKENAAKLEEMEREKDNQVQDMDLLLRKMKTTAEDARKWSFEASRYKEEMEALRVSAQREKAGWITRMREKDRIIGTLNSRLAQLEQEVMVLRQDPHPTALYSHVEPEEMMHPPTPLPGGLLLDHELRELTHEKERLQSVYGKIPIQVVNRHQRHQKEELEEQMHKIDGQLSRIRQKIKRTVL